MARVRLLIAAVLAASALVVLAGPATASVAAANPKFCKAVETIGDTGSSSKPTSAQAKQAIKGFKNAAKYAPGKVKSALNTISKYLGLVANTTDPKKLAEIYTSGDFRDYSKSITTYVKYYSSTCIGSSSP
jgi:hypothetical protein